MRTAWSTKWRIGAGAVRRPSLALIATSASIVLCAFPAVAQASSVSGVSATDTPPSAGAGAKTVYMIGFTTSASGALSSGSQISITFAAPTDTGSLVGSSVTDTTTNAPVGSCFSSSTTVVTCTISSGKSVAAGDQVNVELDGVINSTRASASLPVQVSTTTDTTAASTTYAVVAGQQVEPADGVGRAAVFGSGSSDGVHGRVHDVLDGRHVWRGG